MAAQLLALGLYLPPVFKSMPPESDPPQTIILLPVHTALLRQRAVGALVVLVGVQLSALGSYLPPVFKRLRQPASLHPSQTIIWLPVQTAV